MPWKIPYRENLARDRALVAAKLASDDTSTTSKFLSYAAADNTNQSGVENQRITAWNSPCWKAYD